MSNSFNPSGEYGTPIIELNLSKDLILTGKVLTNGAEIDNPSMELDIQFYMDDSQAFSYNFNDTIEDFTALNSYLKNGLDLSMLPEEFGNHLETVEGSTYYVEVKLYGWSGEQDTVSSNIVTYYKANLPKEWLFKNVYLTTEINGELPGLEAGVVYTCFVNGKVISTVLAQEDENGYPYATFSPDDDSFRIKFDDAEWWRFCNGDAEYTPSVTEGRVSIYKEPQYYKNGELNLLWNQMTRAIKALPEKINSKQYYNGWQLNTIEEIYIDTEGNLHAVDGNDGMWEIMPYYDGNVTSEGTLPYNVNDLLSYVNEYSDVYFRIDNIDLPTDRTKLIYKSVNENWGPVTFTEICTDDDFAIAYLSSEYNTIETADAIEYAIYNNNGVTVKTGWGYYEPDLGPENTTTPLTDLPNGIYTVEITGGGAYGSEVVGLQGTLIIGDVEGSMKWAHNQLLYRSNLTRQNPPSTPADYMKGIAVCARYIDGVVDYINSVSGLSSIVNHIKMALYGKITIQIRQTWVDTSKTLRLTVGITNNTTSSRMTKYSLNIYDKSNNSSLIYTKNVTLGSARPSVNISLTNDTANFVKDNEYKIELTAYTTDNKVGRQSIDVVWPYSKEVTVTSVVLDNDGIASAICSDPSYYVYDATWTLLDADTDEMIDGSGGMSSPVSFSHVMDVGRSYYVQLSDIGLTNGEDYYYPTGTVISNTITYGIIEAEYQLTLDSSLVLDTSPAFDDSHRTGDLLVRLYNTNNECICEPMGADGTIPFDFAQWAQNNNVTIPAGEYYATASDTANSSLTFINSAVVSYGGSGGDESWDPGYTCTLFESGILTLSDSAYETGYYLYKENGDLVEQLSAETSIEWNLSQYMNEGDRYYAIGRWWNDNYDEYTYRSSTITYSSSGGGVTPPEPEQPYVNANLSTTTLNNDIRFDLSFSYNNPDSYIEGAIAKLVNNNTGSTVVSSHRISLGGSEPDVANSTFLAQDIYDNYEQGISYTLTINVYENIPGNSIWDTVTTTFVWPFNSGGGGGGTIYPDISKTPSATLNSDGHIYVSNYDESEYNNTVSVEITENWYSVDGELTGGSTNEYILEEGYVVDSSDLTPVDFSIESNVEHTIRIGYFDESTGDNYWSDSSRVIREI